MKLRFVLLSLFIGFMGACTHKTNDYTMGEMHSSTIDESQLVLSRFPTNMKPLDDSTVGVINSSQHISLYNIRSGENVRNLGFEKLNFDSLITATYAKKYAATKRFVYSKGFELNGENYQIGAFDYSNNRFWIHVSVLVDVYHLKENSTTPKLYEKNEQIKELQEKYGDSISITEMDYLNFIFEANNDLAIKKIFPLYAEASLKENNFYPYYQKQFCVENNNLYAPIGRMDQQFNELQNNMNVDADNYTLSKFNLLNDKKVERRLDFAHINFNDYSLRNYIEAPFRYYSYKNTLLFSNGKEICEIESQKKIFNRQNLAENEWIEAYSIDENNCLVLITFEAAKIQTTHPPKENAPHYKLKFFDLESAQWKKTLPFNSSYTTLALTKNKIVYLDRDNEHYYLKYIPYYEK